MERYKSARNVGIIVAIAAAVYFLPGGGRAAKTFASALWVGFGIGVGYFLLFLYRERRVSVHGLGDRHRLLLYGALAVGAFAWIGRSRMWEGTVGKPAWFVLVACAIYALFLVFRRVRAY